MIVNASELREKDVINTCDGRRLGFICDYLIDTDCGKICAIFVTEQFFGMFSAKNTIKIPWEKIICIGEDTVLVEVRENIRCEPCDCKREKYKKGGWLF